MLAQVLKLRTIVVPALLCAFAVAVDVVREQKHTALVQDPDDHASDSGSPWNKPEAWETVRQFQAMTDRR